MCIRDSPYTSLRVDVYCLRAGVDDSGITSRKLLSMHRHGRGWWCSPAHRRARRSLLSTHRRERQWNNESKVIIHAPAWTRVVVCAGTPNNASMVTVYAPAGTTVVVCAGTPHNTLRVTIHASAWTKVVVCVGTPSVTICDVYRRRTRVSLRRLCCAPARNVCCDTHAS